MPPVTGAKAWRRRGIWLAAATAGGCQSLPAIEAPPLSVATNGNHPSAAAPASADGNINGPPATDPRPPAADPAAAPLPLSVVDLVPPGDGEPVLVLQYNSPAPTQITIMKDGLSALATQLDPLDPWQMDVLQQPYAQTCEVQPGRGLAGAARAGVTVRCRPSLRLAQGQGAAGVIGQADMAQVALRATSSTAFNAPWGELGVLPDAQGFFVADSLNHRLLGFGPGLSATPPAAAVVLGQNGSFTTRATSPVSESSLNGPAVVATDGVHLATADYYNNRVVIYSRASPDGPWQLPVVVGQSSGSGHQGRCQSGLSAPTSVALVDGGLAVTDGDNHRVLFWRTVPTATPAPAPDLVLGQDTASACPSQPVGGGAFATPRGCHFDGTFFYLVDNAAHRVLVYLGMPTGPRQVPDFVLGQTTLAGDDDGHGPGALAQPTSVTADAATVWVADSGNHRVVAYDRAQLATGAAAIYCLGQASCAGNAGANQGRAAAADTLNYPTGVTLMGGQLVVTDTGNHRLLLFPSRS